MEGSVEQRLALLQGLLDTDGTCSKEGAIEYCTASPRLAADAFNLIRSLGFKVSTRQKPAILNASIVGLV